MQKHLGPNKKGRSPSFDSLEERSLLSGVIGWPGGPAAFSGSPAGPSSHSGTGWLAGRAAGGSPMNQGEWSAEPAYFGRAQQPDGGLPWGDPGGFGPSQPGGGSWPGPQGISPFQGGGGPSSPAATSESTTAFAFELNYSAVPFFAQTPGFAGGTTARGSTGAEPGGAGQAFAAEDGVPAWSNPAVVTTSARESGQEPAGVNLVQISQAVTPPAQSSSLDTNSAGHSLALASPVAESAGGPGGGAGLWSLGRARSEHATPARVADHSLIDRVTRLGDPDPDELPGPSRADLKVAAVLPLDRVAIDRALDQFFQQLDDLGTRDRTSRGPARIVLVSLALTSSFMALEAARRRWRRWSAAGDFRIHDQQGGGGLIGFPERPRSWSSRLT
jgi:hypothetical protein